MTDGPPRKAPVAKSGSRQSSAETGETRSRLDPHPPHTAAVLVVFFVCIGFAIFILIFRDLKDNPLAGVLAGAMIALAVSVVLFSIVPSRAPIRAAVGLGGAALFYYMIWPSIERAIHPAPSTQVLRGTIYFINDTHDAGLQPVQGAEVRVPNTSLKSAQTMGEAGDFTIFDVPSNIRDLDVLYKGKTYVLDLSKFPSTARYPVIPHGPSSNSERNQKLEKSLLVDVTLQILGSYWERKLNNLPPVEIQVPEAGGTVRERVCASTTEGYVIDDTRPDFPGGLHVGESGGTGNHRETWDGNCLNLYAEGHGSVWARDVRVALKKLIHGECGRVQKLHTEILYSGVNQIPLDTADALGPCTGPDLPAQLEWKTTVAFLMGDGAPFEIVHFDGFKQQNALNGDADVLDEFLRCLEHRAAVGGTAYRC